MIYVEKLNNEIVKIKTLMKRFISLLYFLLLVMVAHAQMPANTQKIKPFW